MIPQNGTLENLEKVMNKFILVLSFIISMASFASEKASVTASKTITITKLNKDLGKYMLNVKLDYKGCSMYFSSLKPIILSEGHSVSGTVQLIDREVSTSAGDIGKSSTSQFTFKSENGDLEITAACYSNGLFFPTLGLPTLEEVIELSKNQIDLSL